MFLLCAVLSPAPTRRARRTPSQGIRSGASEAGVWAPQWVPAQAWASRRLGSKPGSAFVDRVVLDKLLDLSNPLVSHL